MNRHEKDWFKRKSNHFLPCSVKFKNNMKAFTSSRPSMKAAMLKTVILTLFLLSVIIYDKSSQIKPSNKHVFQQAFRFHVHCPIATKEDGSYLHLMNYLNISDKNLQEQIFQELLQTSTYVVFMKAFPTDAENVANSSVILSYCGFARLKN